MASVHETVHSNVINLFQGNGVFLKELYYKAVRDVTNECIDFLVAVLQC